MSEEMWWKPEARILAFKDGWPPKMIADKLGISVETIRAFLREERKVTSDLPAVRARSARTHSDKKPISDAHWAIGQRLQRYRHKAVTPMNVTDLGRLIKASRLAVSAMEQGLHEYTLSELNRIAKLLDVTVPELMQDAYKPKSAVLAYQPKGLAS